MDHGNGDTGYSGSGSHGLRGNKDPSLPPQPDAHGRGDSDTHQPTRLAGNPSGWGLRPGSLSMEGGVAGGVSDSLPTPPRPALTLPPLMGLVPDLGRPAQPQNRCISALSLRHRFGWRLHILGGVTALAQQSRELARTHFKDKKKEVQRGLAACPRSPSQ